MRILFYKLAIFLLLVFSSKNAFSQGREIKGLFNASTQGVEVGDSCFILPHLFYVNGGHRPCPEMLPACDSIYAFLKQNPSVSIVIMDYTDCRPIPFTNDSLTLWRATRLKEYILEYGDIDPDRITAIGMGDRCPRIVTKEIHKQYKFLPVGQVLSSEYINT
jgi:hypothetical protein